MTKLNKKQSKKEQILQHASDVFARYGYDKTTLDDIGKRCGLNKASLYYYFKNKEEIFVQVISTEAAIFISELQERTSLILSVEDKIVHYLSERIKRYEEVINFTQLSLESLQKVEPLYLNLYQKVKTKEIQFIARLIQEGINTGELEETDTMDLAESLFIISDALKHDRMTQEEVYFDGQYDYEKVEEKLKTIVHLIIKGLKSN
jgi:AcrR family transcriptional regulator